MVWGLWEPETPSRGTVCSSPAALFCAWGAEAGPRAQATRLRWNCDTGLQAPSPGLAHCPGERGVYNRILLTSSKNQQKHIEYLSDKNFQRGRNSSSEMGPRREEALQVRGEALEVKFTSTQQHPEDPQASPGQRLYLVLFHQVALSVQPPRSLCTRCGRSLPAGPLLRISSPPGALQS